MKIFVIGPEFCDSFARNITWTLRKMGHDVATHPGTRHRHDRPGKLNALWSLAETALPQLRASFFASLTRQVRDFRPTLVLVTYNLFSSQQVDALRKAAQAPVFCWYIDPAANVRGDAFFNGAYDIVFAKEPRLVHTLRDLLGVRCELLIECCNPEWHRPHEITPEQQRDYGCDIAGQGTLHAYRAAFFEAFADTGYSVRIWGSAVNRGVNGAALRYFQHRYIGEHEKAVAFRAAKIVVDNMQYTEIEGVNNTLFEAAASGALVLCDDKPTLADSFRPDEEVVVFRSRSEMLGKIRYYLSPAAEQDRLRIRENAWRRAHRDHTYEQRLGVILEHLTRPAMS